MWQTQPMNELSVACAEHLAGEDEEAVLALLEETEGEDESSEEAPKEGEDGVIDANGGDTTSSTALTDEDMATENKDDTAPISSSLFNTETGQALREDNSNDPE